LRGNLTRISGRGTISRRLVGAFEFAGAGQTPEPLGSDVSAIVHTLEVNLTCGGIGALDRRR
jgi:hypothetical protein